MSTPQNCSHVIVLVTDRFIQLETKNLRVNKAHAYVVV